MYGFVSVAVAGFFEAVGQEKDAEAADAEGFHLYIFKCVVAVMGNGWFDNHTPMSPIGLEPIDPEATDFESVVFTSFTKATCVGKRSTTSA